MKRDYERELRNFAAVWQRVTAAKAKPETVKLMPRKDKCAQKSRCGRRCR